MTPEQSWNALEQQADNDLAAMLATENICQLKSTDPLQKIATSLRYTIVWTILIAALYIWILICYPYWQIAITIGVMLLFTLGGIFTAIHQYKKIKTPADSSLPLLATMEQHYRGVSKWVSLQKKAAIFIYPFASAGGFMVGLMFGSGKDLAVLMSKPANTLWLIIVTIVIVPCGLLLAKWLLQKSYGQYLAQLKQNIDYLNAENIATA